MGANLQFTRLPDPPKEYSQEWARDLIHAILLQHQAENLTITNNTYHLANVSTSRTLDPTTATLAQLGQVVASLIQDLINRGMLVAG